MLSTVWGAASGDLLIPHYSWDHNSGHTKAEGLPFKEIDPYEKYFSRGLKVPVYR
jgi:hypothetical protein